MSSPSRPPIPPLTINTDQPARHSSPSPPPISPLTPTLPPARLPGQGQGQGQGQPQHLRQTFTHNEPRQVAIPPPAPEPIAFDSNPDVIALRSAISILQMQKQRAVSDVRVLDKAKDDAVREPEAFMSDLFAGKVNAPAGAAGRAISSTDDTASGDDAGSSSSSQHVPAARSWVSLPVPQDVVRCPPINWSKYAVVGESLDKLHAEQVARPTQGTPATIGANGAYEFHGDGVQEQYQGVAAPFNPLKDKISKKTKSKK